MEAPKLYHHIAFRLTVYALLAIIGGVNIWGEQLLKVPTTHSQTVTPIVIQQEVTQSNPPSTTNEANVVEQRVINIPLNIPTQHIVPREFGIEIVFQAYGALIRIFL